MKDSVTKFDFDDAFKALDEIEIPKAPKGIKANREDLHETMKRVDKFELLFEDFYDVNDSEDMNAASEEREAEVAKAKLARIEKIVDLDAESEDDILPSYVGKTIIQCPQCMMLFYKDAEDISKDEENPDLVNIGEVCQHCGNDSGYDIIGKVAEETEEVPADDFNGEETTTEETSNGENDLSIEGEATSEEGEVDELSAEADLDELDLDLEEEPAEEEEEIKEESLNTSELLKKIEDKNDLKTENESEKLTLNEDIEDNLDDALKDHEEYIEYLRAMIKQEEEALSKATNEQVKKAIQKRIDAFREDLEAALPDAVKAEAQEEELPDAEEAGMEDATDNTVEDAEETTESLHEGKFGKLEAPSEDLSFLANEFDKALEAAHDLKYDIEIKDGYIISVTSFNIKQVDDIAKECFAKHDLVPVITVVSEFVHDYKLAPQDKAAEPAQESLHNSETQEKAEEQSDLKTENESKNLTLNEAAGNNISDADFNELLSSNEFKKPISASEVRNYFEGTETEDNDTETLTEAGGPIDRGRLFTVASTGNYTTIVTMPFLNPKEIGASKVVTNETIAQCPVMLDKYIKAYGLKSDKEANAKKENKAQFEAAQKDAKATGKTRLTIKNYKMLDGTPKTVDNAPVQQVNFYLTRGETDASSLLKAGNEVKASNNVLYIGTYNVYSNSLDLSPLAALNKKVAGTTSDEVEYETEVKPETDDKPIEEPVETGEPKTPEDRKVYLTKILEKTGKKFMPVFVSADKKSYAAASSKIYDKASSFELLLTKLPKAKGLLGAELDKAIILVDAALTPTLNVEVKDKELGEADILATCGSTESSCTTLLKTVADKVGVVFDTSEPAEDSDSLDLEETDESFNVTEINEQSFNEALTESLQEVYENVDNFIMTDCTLNGTTLIVEGTINFKSGKNRTTQYIFESCQNKDSNIIVLEGINKDLFESGKIKITAEILNESLSAKSLKYKYSIGANLVEG